MTIACGYASSLAMFFELALDEEEDDNSNDDDDDIV